MKNLILLILLITSNTKYSQSTVDINFINGEKVLLNGISINNQTHISNIVKILGKPKIHKKHKNGKINYHFEEKGISIHTIKDKIVFLGINYNWDKDKNFPETSYKGKLMINTLPFDKNTKEGSLYKIKNIEFIDMFIPGLFISKLKKSDTHILVIIGFKENKITQVSFDFMIPLKICI